MGQVFCDAIKYNVMCLLFFLQENMKKQELDLDSQVMEYLCDSKKTNMSSLSAVK